MRRKLSVQSAPPLGPHPKRLAVGTRVLWRSDSKWFEAIVVRSDIEDRGPYDTHEIELTDGRHRTTWFETMQVKE